MCNSVLKHWAVWATSPHGVAVHHRIYRAETAVGAIEASRSTIDAVRLRMMDAGMKRGNPVTWHAQRLDESDAVSWMGPTGLRVGR